MGTKNCELCGTPVTFDTEHSPTVCNTCLQKHSGSGEDFTYSPIYGMSLSREMLNILESTSDSFYFLEKNDTRTEEELVNDFDKYYGSELFAGYDITKNMLPEYFGAHPKCKPINFLFRENGKDVLAVAIVKSSGVSHPAIKSVKEACEKKKIKYLRFLIGSPNTEHYVIRKTLELLKGCTKSKDTFIDHTASKAQTKPQNNEAPVYTASKKAIPTKEAKKAVPTIKAIPTATPESIFSGIKSFFSGRKEDAESEARKIQNCMLTQVIGKALLSELESMLPKISMGTNRDYIQLDVTSTMCRILHYTASDNTFNYGPWLEYSKAKDIMDFKDEELYFTSIKSDLARKKFREVIYENYFLKTGYLVACDNSRLGILYSQINK